MCIECTSGSRDVYSLRPAGGPRGTGVSKNCNVRGLEEEGVLPSSVPRRTEKGTQALSMASCVREFQVTNDSSREESMQLLGQAKGQRTQEMGCSTG